MALLIMAICAVLFWKLLKALYRFKVKRAQDYLSKFSKWDFWDLQNVQKQQINQLKDYQLGKQQHTYDVLMLLPVLVIIML